MEKFDQNILFEFLPEDDKKSFMVWDSVILTSAINLKTGEFARIVATYRAPFEERIYIRLDEYRQKERDIKINKILL